MPIGFFDSGLGGLTVLEAVRKRLPGQEFIYLGDSASAPYGTRDRREVYRLTLAGVKILFSQGCDLVVLACNTASAVALHALQVGWLDPSERRVLGVFVPVIEFLTRRDWGDNSPPTHTGLRDVALFATPATVRSGAFSARTEVSRPGRHGHRPALCGSGRRDRIRRSRPRPKDRHGPC